MASTSACAELLSSTERSFITSGIIEHNIRLDGRKCTDRRKYFIEAGAVPQAVGSARVILQDSINPTDVIVAIKGDLKPVLNHPAIFKKPQELVVVSIDSGGISPLASKAALLESRNLKMAAWFSDVLCRCLDSRSLSLEETANFGWGLRLEVLIICELGGGLVEAIGLALNAALKSCKLPSVCFEQGSEVNEGLSLDEANTRPIRLPPALPVYMEIGCLGPHHDTFLGDLSVAERLCCHGVFWVALEPLSRQIYSLESAFCSQLLPSACIIESLSAALSLCQHTNED
jgi:exosome complex RNA-binding protein Rrp42 (RNase PH superfamily)